MSDTLGFGTPAAPPVGRPTSPKLYIQAGHDPDIVQFRVWKIENGVGNGLGTIDANATEEDLVRQWITAMPKPGEGRAQFKLRPIDINGQERGEELTIIISEHHADLRAARAASSGTPPVNGAGISSMPGYPGVPSELFGLFEKIANTAEERAKALERSLEAERERVRREDAERAKERIELASSAAGGVQVVTERLLADESRRAELALKQQQEVSERAARAQSDQANTLLTTLTSIFSQSQAQMQAMEEARRRADEFRADQERQRAERELRDAEDRRRRDQAELEERRRREAEEATRKLEAERVAAEAKIARERQELDQKLAREMADIERKERIAKDEAERKERVAREEAERKERLAKEDLERRERLDREMASQREQERQRQHERMIKEMELAATQQREHAERMMALSKAEQSAGSSDALMTLLPKAAGMLKNFGIEPADVVSRILGGAPEGDGGAGWAEAIPKVIGVIGDVMQANIRARAAQAQQQTLPPNLVLPMYPQPPQLVQQPGTAQPEPVEPTPAPENTPAAPPQPAPSQEIADATKAGLSLAVQREARNAIRDAVRKIRNSSPDKWQEIILVAISNSPSILHYCSALSLRRALVEAGAEQDLAQRVIDGVRESGMVPPDLNYG